MFLAILKSMNLRNYANITVNPLFVRENMNINKHNEKMFYILFDENSAFTQTDLKEAHKKLDLEKY